MITSFCLAASQPNPTGALATADDSLPTPRLARRQGRPIAARADGAHVAPRLIAVFGSTGHSLP